MQPPASDITDFQSSTLGTKDHWDAAYKRELDNFNSHGDPGEIWFENCVETLLDWLDEQAERIEGLKESDVLDIGCGNGYTLIELAERGWTQLHGCDYSAAAIDLAKGIAEKKQLEIQYFVDDIFHSQITRTFRLLLDKGTFDAIALNPDRALRDAYVTAVRALAAPNSIFVITSCNFTREEIVKVFTSSSRWKTWKSIEYPTISYAGQEGSTVCTVAFKPVA